MSSPSTAKLARPEPALLHPGDRPPATENHDRRADPRLGPAELPGLDHVRLKHGPIVTLVDLSAGGAQIEMANHRLQPGAPLVMQIVGHDKGLFAVPAQVLRCHVSALGGHPTYRGAVEFGRRLELEQLLRSVRPHDLVQTCRPHFLADGILDVDRPAAVVHDEFRPSTFVSAAGLAAAQAMIQSVSTRRGSDCTRPMGILLRNMTPLFERGIPRGVVLESVLRAVRRMIPGAAIQLVDTAQFDSVSGDDAFYIDIPAGSAPGRRLLIEFAGGQLETGHLELLRLAAHLMALTDDLA